MFEYYSRWKKSKRHFVNELEGYPAQNMSTQEYFEDLVDKGVFKGLKEITLIACDCGDVFEREFEANGLKVKLAVVEAGVVTLFDNGNRPSDINPIGFQVVA